MIEIILFIIGLGLLIKGSGLLVDGASSISKKLGIPTLIIGLTVVAIGTSMPELAINIISSFQGHGEIALGNAIGSNITNIFLILGLAAIIIPLKTKKEIIKNELPVALFAGFLLLILAGKSFIEGAVELTTSHGLILILVFIIYLYFIVVLALKKQNHDFKNIREKKIGKSILFTLIGIACLAIGANWTVNGALEIARLLGLNTYFISATIIAIGTSLPELATVIQALKKNEIDLGFGDIIGANTINILLNLGISSIIHPLKISFIQGLDLIIMIIATLLLFIPLLSKNKTISRTQGVLFVVCYFAFLVFLILR